MSEPQNPPSQLELVEGLAARAEALGLEVERYSQCEEHLAIIAGIPMDSSTYLEYASTLSTDKTIQNFSNTLDYYQFILSPTNS